ncbi:Gfo/Idh/MocA family oxidoreductase [Agromyces seonyuensis]|uniref:Gfo/Idh/MocA family oxidoreductase n=1 Tax=Agromyces seonyuensis TaxID=2662446 RepID=A0A6I4NXM2_9MICO|nr:gfo/Idh/MocA family oxidoreductase [Agromyces seonyuensis]
MSALRVALVGIGAMGRHHARLLREIDGLELVAIVDRGGDPYGVAGGLEVLEEVDDALAVGIDAAVIAVPTAAHEPVGRQFAEAGVHFLVEKPVAETVEGGLRLAAAAAATGVVGAVGHVERFNPAVAALRSELAAGRLGRITRIEARRQSPYPARIRDVGVGKDLSVHDLDLAAWLGGGAWGPISARSLRAAGHPHEDVLVVDGLLGDDVRVQATANWISPVRERLLIVTGELGVLVADTAAGTLGVRAADGRATSPLPVGDAEPLRAELEAFRDAIAGFPSSIATLEEGTAALAAVEAALESARTGRSAVRADATVAG